MSGLIRRALDIGQSSYDGDSWYAKHDGLTTDMDDGEAAFVDAYATLAALRDRIAAALCDPLCRGHEEVCPRRDQHYAKAGEVMG